MKLLIILLMVTAATVFAEEKNGLVKHSSVRLPIFGAVPLPKTAIMKVSYGKSFLVINVQNPEGEGSFWCVSEINPPEYHLQSMLSSLSLVSGLGTQAEIRLTVVPRNIEKDVKRYEFEKIMKVPLFIGSDEVGFATLFTRRGAVNTNKTVYTINRTYTSELGDEFVVIAGNPFAHHVNLKIEQADDGGRE